MFQAWLGSITFITTDKIILKILTNFNDFEFKWNLISKNGKGETLLGRKTMLCKPSIVKSIKKGIVVYTSVCNRYHRSQKLKNLDKWYLACIQYLHGYCERISPKRI